MKKKANRRALFVFVTVTLIYSILGFDFHRKMEIKRLRPETETLLQSFEPPRINETQKERQRWHLSNDNPFSFASLLLLCAISEGKIDGDYLILVERGGNISWKKPLEIIKDKDREGLRSLSQILGKVYLLRLLEKEGIEVPKGLNAEDILLGKGYSVTKEKMAELYRRYVHLLSNIEKEIQQKEPVENKGFSSPSTSHWIMPNLKGYPMREAIYSINKYTTKIKVFGFGEVQNQKPLPYEKVTGETECVLWGTVN